MDVADVFDDWAKRGRAEGMEEGHGRTAGPLLASLMIQPGSRFLDLGCGNGWAARSAAARGAHAVGIDASAEMVARAAEHNVPNTEFVVGDFANIDAPDGHFDTAWSMEALYYAPDPDTVLKEVRRVAKEFHMIIDHYQENEASHSWSADLGVHMSLRSEAEWVAAFEAAGFKNVHAQRLRATEGEAWKMEQGSLYVRGA